MTPRAKFSVALKSIESIRQADEIAKSPHPYDPARSAMLEGEQGVVMIIVAVAAFLLVLLSVGFTIDLPTTQSAVEKAQNAMDIGSVHSLYSFSKYQESGDAAFLNADAVLSNTYAPTIAGNYSTGFEAEGSHSLWIPRLGAGNPYSDVSDLDDYFKAYTCDRELSTTPCTEQIPSNIAHAPQLLSTINRIIDTKSDTNPGGIDDFKNMLLFYGRFTPLHYLSFLPDHETRLITVARLSNALSYVLVDPAFSLDPVTGENFDLVFGPTATSSGVNDDYIWPVGALRKSDGTSQNNVVYPQQKLLSSNPSYSFYGNGYTSWADDGYPDLSYANLFGTSLPKGELLSAANTQSTIANFDSATIDKIYHFYASACDTLPFFHFKSAAVNMIDRLSQSSAYNTTMMIGLTGYKGAPSGGDPDLRLVPIYPVNTDSLNVTYAQHPDSAAYPIPKHLDGSTLETHNAYAHTAKTAGYLGFVNSQNINESSVGGSPTGLNRWELCYCRGLMGSNRPTTETGYITSEDVSGGDESGISHGNIDNVPNRAKRARDTSGVANWCDDESAGGADYDINFEQGRSGTGETPRNMIANLAIRSKRTGFSHLYPAHAGDPAVTTWTRPIEDATATPQPNKLEFGNGWRYLPTSIKAACEKLNAAELAYDADSDYGSLRSAKKKTLILYAFGIYNQDALTDLGKNASQAMDDFEASLRYCLCNDPDMTLFLNFLPLTAADRSQVDAAIGIINQFENDHNNTCVGNGGASPCDVGTSSSVFTFDYDWTSPRFSTPDGSHAVHESTAKLLAAEAFQKETYDLVTKLMVRYVYAK